LTAFSKDKIIDDNLSAVFMTEMIKDYSAVTLFTINSINIQRSSPPVCHHARGRSPQATGRQTDKWKL